ncbi:hypothetical protein [Pandoraea apista]|uniref:Uncharacterized protein n=1 Tax=Pandoraea apista TaxID=93218 RepID=A0ABX9ZRY1_9BURK|nr:hypothetical protein [Pandoraea apista]AVF40598.1 hypothetical protein AL486_13425 [Pandoraea apista]PTE01771.1 hypothetical protein C7830_07805 [Pandoraea apista]RRJ28532.1 hypothetical protein EIB05_18670 [Pandoraea apista]RRJ28551.1 hypothetical protein EIB05_18765 [Pandoraea apista]RRJ73917.1 hypothetical protein EIL82_18210 [Pandoraea apista]
MFDSLVDGFSTAFPAVQTEIYTRIMQPVLFATGLISFAANGIRDPLPPQAGRLADYGEGFRARQWFGLRRLWASVPARRPGASDSASRTDGTGRTKSA